LRAEEGEGEEKEEALFASGNERGDCKLTKEEDFKLTRKRNSNKQYTKEVERFHQRIQGREISSSPLPLMSSTIIRGKP